jgi:hypothetical protein
LLEEQVVVGCKIHTTTRACVCSLWT